MQQQQQQRHPQQKQAAAAEAAALAAAAAAAAGAPAAEASSTTTTTSSSSSRKASVRSDSNTRGCEGQPSLFRATAKPIHAKTELKHTERGTQHCNNGRPTTVCDPYRPNRKDSLVSVSNSYSLVIHEGSPPQFPCKTSTGGAPEDHLLCCNVEFQSFKRLYPQLTFFNFLDKLQSVPPTGIHPSYS